MSKIAVVILNWNGQKLLEKFLPSIVKYTSHPEVELVVADNASTDNSIDFLKANYPQVRIIALADNYGFAQGYNLALEQIDAEYFVLLNSDVEVSHNWLAPMIDYLDANLDVAAMQPKILSQREKSSFEYAGASGGYIDTLGVPFCRGRIFGVVEQDNGQYNHIVDVFWASGACFLIRAKDYFEVGGLDPQFFAHMEEIDLCWRLKARGRRIVCFPKSIVYHVGAATLSKDSPNKIYLNFRNNLLMLYKNIDDSVLNKTLHRRKRYDNIAAIKYMLSGEMKNAKAIFKAHKDFEEMRKTYADTRQNNLNATSVNLIREIYRGNIVLDYYIRGKKLFSELDFL